MPNFTAGKTKNPLDEVEFSLDETKISYSPKNTAPTDLETKKAHPWRTDVKIVFRTLFFRAGKASGVAFLCPDFQMAITFD